MYDIAPKVLTKDEENFFSCKKKVFSLKNIGN